MKSLETAYLKMHNYADSLFEHTVLLNKCLSGYIFVRFMTDKHGRIKTIETNEGTPAFLDTIIKNLVTKGDSYWKPTRKNEPYFLPINYNLSYGCVIDTSSKTTTALERLMERIPNNTSGPPKNSNTYSFHNINNFEKTHELSDFKMREPFSCIMLTPFIFTSSAIPEKWN